MVPLRTSDASIVAALVALCVATNYVLVGVPNVKIMDFLVFIGGFCFGAFAGTLIGALTWTVYGVINPYGFVPQVWLATMFSESIYGVAGGLLRKSLSVTDFNGRYFRLSVFFGAMGFLLTLIYDVITNIAYALTLMEKIPIALVILYGVPFTLLHEISNATIFGVGSIPTITAISKIVERETLGISKK